MNGWKGSWSVSKSEIIYQCDVFASLRCTSLPLLRFIICSRSLGRSWLSCCIGFNCCCVGLIIVMDGLGVGVALEKIRDGGETCSLSYIGKDACSLETCLFTAVAAVAFLATFGATPITQGIGFVYFLTVSIFQAARTEVEGAGGAFRLDFDGLLTALVACCAIFRVVDPTTLDSDTWIGITLLFVFAFRCCCYCWWLGWL